MNQSMPIVNSLYGYIVFYTIVIAIVFRDNARGPRPWRPRDYVWVPACGLGGLTVIALLLHAYAPHAR